MGVNRFELPVNYPPDGKPVIRMRGISKVFHSAVGETTVLKGIDVDVLQGQFISVVGRSGSGKSTLVNMITGIDRPSGGSVEVGGASIMDMPESAMAVWRGKNLGIVFQFFQLLPMLTLLENVMLPMDFCGIYPPASRAERALELLGRVGVADLAHSLPGAVAGGQQQCAAVARALANDPPILIADEPTGNLDSHTAEQIMGIFEELSKQGKTILIVTHDRLLAQRTQRRLIISDGELVHEALSAAFPEADHSHLLQLSKQAAPLKLAPMQPLPLARTADAPVYLLTAGSLVTAQEDGMDVTVSSPLIDPLGTPREVHAAGQGAELLALPRAGISTLVSGIGLPSGRSSSLPENDQPGSDPRQIWRAP